MVHLILSCMSSNTKFLRRHPKMCGQSRNAPNTRGKERQFSAMVSFPHPRAHGVPSPLKAGVAMHNPTSIEYNTRIKVGMAYHPNPTICIYANDNIKHYLLCRYQTYYSMWHFRCETYYNKDSN